MKKLLSALFIISFSLSTFAQDNNKQAKAEPKQKTRSEKDQKIEVTREKRDVKPKKSKQAQPLVQPNK